MGRIKLYMLLNLVDADQKIEIYYKDKILWSGLKKNMNDIVLGDCYVSSINIDKQLYPVLEINMFGSEL